ncbi:MAG: Ku protein [Vicinamibacterales bacterium]
MAPRASWTGHLKISLATFGVRLYNAVTEAEKVKLCQVHKPAEGTCLARVKMPATCPVHGPIERAEIAKACEVEKDRYVVLDQDELAAIKLRSEKTIEIERFVPAAPGTPGSIDPVYFDSTYYVGPDGPLSAEPFRVFRAALEKTGMVGIGKLAVSGRERTVVLRPHGRGLAITTLHAAAEVRDADAYFADLPDAADPSAALAPEHLELASRVVASKAGAFDPASSRDRFQEALVDLVKSKAAGQPPVVLREEDPGAPPTFSFAEALRQSLAEGIGAEKPKIKAKSKSGRKTSRKKAG